MAPLAAIEVDVVVTARDLGRQATAHWQEEVKLGDTRSFAELEHDQLRADVPAGEAALLARPGLRGGAAPVGDGGPGRARPPWSWGRRGPPDVLWRRFAEACGISQEAAAVVDADAVAPANRSLTTEAIALLREVNRELEGRLTPREHARLVKRELAEGRLAVRRGRPPRTPASLADVLTPAATAWGRQIEASRHPVHGSLDDLTPVLAGPATRTPTRYSRRPGPAEVADVVREVRRPKPCA